MPTSLTVYSTTLDSSTLSTAEQLISAGGGAQGSTVNINLAVGTGWGEIWTQGNAGAWPQLGAIGNPSGRGLLFDVTTLESQTIVAGNWTPTWTFEHDGVSGSLTVDIVTRFYNRSSGGVYTSIGSVTHTGRTIGVNAAQHTPSAVNLSAMSFGTGDKLYVDVWFNVTTNSFAGSNVQWRPSNSTTQGWTGSQVVTPGYDPSAATSTHDLASRARIAATVLKDLASRARISQLKLDDLVSRARIAPLSQRDLASRARLLPLSPLGSDTFIRANQSGFGVASDGQTWQMIEGNEAASITGNTGQITAGNGSAEFVLGTRTARDIDITVRVKSTADEDRMGIAARLQDATTHYRVIWSEDQLRIIRNLADAKTTIGTAAFTINGTAHDNFYWIRTQLIGGSPTTCRAKIWQDGTSEPGTWAIDAQDTNPLNFAGLHGLHFSCNVATNIVAINSYTALDLSLPRDLAARAGISALRQNDLAALARVQILQFPSEQDLASRAHIAGLGLRDLVSRANVANAAQPLPAHQPATFTATIGGIEYLIKVDSVTISESIDGRSTCDFTIIDLPGSLHIQHRQPVKLTHSVRGTIFRGFINSANEVNLLPNPTNEVRVTCIDEHWLADKRAYFGDDYTNQFAGSIAVDLARILVEEGLTVTFAADRDSTVADFSEGTLTNVVASSIIEDGALELAPSGSVISVVEADSNDFLDGTLDGTAVNTDGVLTLASEPALRFTADCTVPGGGDLYTFQRFYFGNNLIASGDQLQYEVWISSTSPQIKAAIDFLCSDGTQLAKSTPTDQIGLDATPNGDLAGFADDQWYARSISLNTLAGKTIQHVSVAFGGDEVGPYTAYFRRVRLVDDVGNIKQEFYNGLPISSWGGMANNGYTNILLKTVTAYEKQGSRTSTAYPLTGAGIARNSIIAWTAIVPENIDLEISASLDLGNTWQRCENFRAIPGLLPGLALAGRSLLIRETITNNSPSPEQTAALSSLSATVQPSWSATKQDRVISVNNDADWLAGTISGLIVTDGALTLNQRVYDWNDGLVDINAFGTSSPGADATTRQLKLSTGATSDVRHRLDGALEWQNFIAEIDIKIPAAGSVGLVYRTTGWQNNNHTYAYSAHVSTTQIALSRGTNSAIGAGAETVLDTAAVTLDADGWHRLKVVVSGSNHEVFLDEVSYCFAVDSTHSGAGFFGARYNNTSGSPATALLDNFGVVSALSGTWTSPPFDLTSATAVQDSFVAWTATTPESASVVIEASINGGASFFDCENGLAISILSRTTILEGMSLQLKATLSSGNASTAPVLSALSATVVGMLGAFGERIGQPLSLDALGSRVGSSQISWNAQLASEETVLNVEVSLNGVNWFDASEDNGAEIPIIFSQTEPFIESFDKQSTDYSSMHLADGEDATWQIDATQSRLVGTGGIEGLYRYDVLADFIDGEIYFDSDRCDNGGLIWKFNEEAMSCYELAVSDDLGVSPAGMLRLYRVVGGMKTQLGNSALIPFVRGVPTRFRVSQDVWDITISVDGREILIYHDNDPLGEGYIALRSSGGTQQYSQLRIVEYGDDLSSQLLYVRQRLSTTDPLNSPQLTDLTVAVYGPSIGPGALIPATTYSVVNGSENSIAQDLDDLASQSEYWWRIKNSVLYFQPRSGVPAPWIATGANMLAESKVQVSRVADLYRNEQVIIGGSDLEDRIETRFADGFRAGFDTDIPIDSITRLQINGQDVSFGLKDVDTGKDWFFQRGEKGIVQAEDGTPLAVSQEITIAYRGIINVVVSARRDGQIVLLAAQDGTSGVVTVVEKADGLNLDAATQLALSRLKQYAKLSVDLAFTTMRPGLAPGQLLTVFLPQHGLLDETFLITSVDYAPSPRGQSDLYEYFSVKATSGPSLGDWTKLFA